MESDRMQVDQTARTSTVQRSGRQQVPVHLVPENRAFFTRARIPLTLAQQLGDRVELRTVKIFLPGQSNETQVHSYAELDKVITKEQSKSYNGSAEFDYSQVCFTATNTNLAQQPVRTSFVTNVENVVAIIQPKLSDIEAHSVLVEFDPPLSDPFAILTALRPQVENAALLRIRADENTFGNWIIDLSTNDLEKVLLKDSNLLGSTVITTTPVTNNMTALIDRVNALKYTGDTLGLTDDELNEIVEEMTTIARGNTVRVNLWEGANSRQEPIAVIYATTNSVGRKALIEHGPITHNGKRFHIRQPAPLRSRLQQFSNVQQFQQQRIDHVQASQQQFEQQIETRVQNRLDAFEQQLLAPMSLRLDKLEPVVESLREGQQKQQEQYNRIEASLNLLVSRSGNDEDEVQKQPHKKARKQ